MAQSIKGTADESDDFSSNPDIHLVEQEYQVLPQCSLTTL